MNRDLISVKTNRLPPELWCKFSCASTLMRMQFSGYPVKLKADTFSNTFVKSRYPGLLFGYDSSKTKVGKQMTRNLCAGVLSQIKVPKTNNPMTKDRLRVLLEFTF